MSLYFDHNATTPLASEVLEEMLPYLRQDYGNAASIHRPGQRARAAVERARAQVAELIHCEPIEIVFSSGGTESNNIAILGAVRENGKARKHVIASVIEHHAVLRPCQALEREEVEVTYVPVSAAGLVEAEEVRKALRPETVLISIMHANNETGAVQPVKEIAAIAREAGVLFHCDAVQSAGKIPVDVNRLGVDLLSMSAHKFGGPKGVGALYIRQGVRLHPLMFGGMKELDTRPGTENVAGIVGMGAAARLAAENMDIDAQQMARLRDRLETGILERIERAGVNGNREAARDGEWRRMPNTTNLYFDFVDGEALVIALDLQGIACSTGSACSSGSVEPSHVLLAMGISAERARSSVRFSLGKTNTEEDVDALLRIIVPTVKRLRDLSPRMPEEMREAVRG